MDEPIPTAADLGVNEGEYERILRDLRRRGGDDVPGAVPVLQRRPHRRARLAALGALGALLVVSQLGADGAGDQDPTYAFLTMAGDQPVTYTSCRQIQVAVYPQGGPPDAEELVREAVGRMRTATGLDIVVTGTFGGHAPNWNFEAAPIHPDDPISVSWQDSQTIATLTDHIAGLGGSRVITASYGQRLAAGTIALSREYYAQLTERGDHPEALAVLLHEFGHVFGLDHVDSPNELMYDDNTDLTDFGPGDLEGLRRLGRGPCI